MQKKQEKQENSGITLLTVHAAKGLEFDQVFVVFPEKDQSALAKQGRYIAATRALHELYMYSVLTVSGKHFDF